MLNYTELVRNPGLMDQNLGILKTTKIMSKLC